MKQVFISTILGMLLFFLTTSVNAQNSNREYIEHFTENNIVIIKVNDGTYKLVPFNEQIIHTTFLPKDSILTNYSYAVDVESDNTKFEISETSDILSLKTKDLEVEISKVPFQINYIYKNESLINEASGYSINDTTQIMTLGISNDEVLYGAGARVLGMDRRGYKLDLYNKAHYGYQTHSELMNYTLPVFISSKKYAILFDNASKGWLDLDSNKDNTVSYEATNGTINYYVIAGNDWYNLTEQYTHLTGRQPLPPRWAFGNFSSRFGYHSQEETENTIDKYFEDSIPVDAVIIDIYWFGKDVQGHMGNLDWFRDSFPNPKDMMKRLSDKGVKTILVTEPFILTTCKRWDEAVEENVLGTDSAGNPYTYDFFFGNTGLVDVFDPKGKDWFWDIYKDLVDQGVSGWWGDLGEPEVHPEDLQHLNGSADAVHNAYGHEWAKLIYEGYEKDFPNTRPFILMRSGYAGSQRYGMIPWTGDVSRSWGGLVPQVEISLQMGMQGIAYMHSDLGGFAGGDSLNNELYTRWLQYGVFQPIYRPHAQESIPSEPVFQTKTTKQHAKTAIELRYKLLPYNYSLAKDNSLSGRPLMSPLFYIEPDNKELLTYDEAYMWGDAFLVAPIKESGKSVKKVYLPKNSEWINFYNGNTYQGGQFIEVKLSLENIPVFVKSGSFIPMMKKAQNTKSYSLDSFDMHYYHSNTANNINYNLYNDDGITPDKTNINQEFYTFKSVFAKDLLKFDIVKKVEGNELCTQNNIDFIIHQINNKPKAIRINSTKLNKKDFTYTNTTKTLHIPVEFTNRECSLEIEL